MFVSTTSRRCLIGFLLSVELQKVVHSSAMSHESAVRIVVKSLSKMASEAPLSNTGLDSYHLASIVMPSDRRYSYGPVAIKVASTRSAVIANATVHRHSDAGHHIDGQLVGRASGCQQPAPLSNQCREFQRHSSPAGRFRPDGHDGIRLRCPDDAPTPVRYVAWHCYHI